MLDKIIEFKRKQVDEERALFPIKLLEKSHYFDSECVKLSDYLSRPNMHGIIAEFKRKSPSKGIINAYAEVLPTTLGYMQSGASALSVLTESRFFMGKNEDLIIARDANFCPILRKDFIIDEYQIIESKSIGADVLLLIAAVLTKEELSCFFNLAEQLGMETLFEIHEVSELDKLPANARIIGVNNRNLKTMEVDVESSLRIAEQLPKSAVLIAESGLSNPQLVHDLSLHGFKGFLMGEYFMRHGNPPAALGDFVNELSKLSKQTGLG